MLHFTPAALRRLAPLATLLGTLALVGTVSAAPAPDQSVTIDGFAFSPTEITVPVGGTAVWTNVQAGVPHTVTSADVTTFDSGVMATNDTFSHTFTQVGDFAYQCEIHPSMHGTVHVVAAAATTDQAAEAPAVDAAAALDAAGGAATAPAATSTASLPATPAPTTAALATPAAPAAPTSAPVAQPTAPAAPITQPTATPAAYYGY
jgi:plastocyanin